MSNPVPHATLRKFGYPGSLIHEGEHWAVLLRPSQPTLGSLVLCALGEQTGYGELAPGAFDEQGGLVAKIERVLRNFSHYERINYLMLMMVDPHVHFHVLPRYEGAREFEGTSFTDAGWPGLPDLAASQPAAEGLILALRQAWQDDC